MSWKLLRSKTVWGAVLVAAASVVTSPAVTVSVVLKAVGTVLAAAGVRDAAQKIEDASKPPVPAPVTSSIDSMDLAMGSRPIGAGK